MWRDAEVALVSLTRAAAQVAHAAPHTSAWAIVVSVFGRKPNVVTDRGSAAQPT